MKVYFPLKLFEWKSLEIGDSGVQIDGPETSLGFLPVYPDLETLFAEHGKDCRFGILNVIEEAHTEERLEQLEDLKDEAQRNYRMAKSFRIPHKREIPRILRNGGSYNTIEHKPNAIEDRSKDS